MDNKLFELCISEKTNWMDMCSQHVWSLPNDDGITVDFHVSDLGDCPEDARIGRDLFDGWDFISAIKLGFHIADMGYGGIHVTEVDEDDNE